MRMGSPLFVDHLLGSFSVDGGDEEESATIPFTNSANSGLETIKGKFSQDTCQSHSVGNFSFPLFVLKLKEMTELRKMISAQR